MSRITKLIFVPLTWLLCIGLIAMFCSADVSHCKLLSEQIIAWDDIGTLSGRTLLTFNERENNPLSMSRSLRRAEPEGHVFTSLRHVEPEGHVFTSLRHVEPEGHLCSSLRHVEPEGHLCSSLRHAEPEGH